MERMKVAAAEYTPWKPGISWQAIAIQAALAGVIGLYFLIAPDSAASTIRLLLGLLLVVCSLIDLKTGYTSFHTIDHLQSPGTPFLLARGGAGVAIGLFYFLVTRSEYMTEDDARYVLGFGMVAYAVIGFLALVAEGMQGRFRVAPLLANILFLLVGAVLIYNRREGVSESSAVEYIGVAAIIGAVSLAVYAWYLRSEALRAPVVPDAVPDAALPPLSDDPSAMPLIDFPPPLPVVPAEPVAQEVADIVDAPEIDKSP